MSSSPSNHRTFEFWLGRSGAGKTHGCIQAAAGELRQRPRGAPLLLIVPEQASAQMEYALATQPGPAGFTRARVLSFRHLQMEIFKRAGGRPPDVIDEEARVMLLRRCIRLLKREERLRSFAATADVVGFAESVSATLLEFQRYGWDAAELEQRVAALTPDDETAQPGGRAETEDRHLALRLKLEDLAAVWRAYEAELEARGLYDAALLAEAAARRLREWDGLAEARLWIDGFASFTVQELNLIEALLERAASAAMTLCLDPRDAGFRLMHGPNPKARARRRLRIGPERVFDNIERTYMNVRGRVERLGWRAADVEFPREADRPTRFSDAPALAHLEANVLTRLRPRPCSDAAWEAGEDARVWPEGPVEILEAEDRRAEVKAAARRIAALCSHEQAGSLHHKQKNGDSGQPGNPNRRQQAGSRRRNPPMQWREVVVLARDLSVYAPLVREIFPRFGIPFFLDERRSLVAHPVSRLLLAALAIARDDWRGGAALDYLKTGLSPLADAPAVAAIEAEARRLRLSGRDWIDRDAWNERGRVNRARTQSEDKTQADRLFEIWRRAVAPALELRRELSRLEACTTKQSQETEEERDPARALWDFLKRLDVAARLEQWIEQARADGDEEVAMIHQQAWKQTVALLDRLHSLGLGGRENGEAPNALFEELREAIETGLATTSAGLIPPTLDQVLVGSAERSRPPAGRAAFVLGLADGEFPRVFEEDPMLNDRERERIAPAGRELGPDSVRRFNQERFIGYLALTRPSEYLCLSRPAADGAGRALGPSSFFRAAAEGFPQARPQWIATDGDVTDRRRPHLPLEWTRTFVGAMHDARRGRGAAALLEALAGRHPLTLPEVGLQAGSLHHKRDRNEERQNGTKDRNRKALEIAFEALDWPRPAALDPDLARSFWLERAHLPVTAMENYAACPFQFFAGRMMRLESPREPLPGPMELGSLRHYILDKLFRELNEDGRLDWGGIDLARAREIVDRAARDGAEEALAEHFGRDALTRTFVELIAREMHFFVGALRAMGERCGFVQVASELRFGRGDEDSLLRLPIDGELAFTLHGTIDRIDRDAVNNTAHLVFDFKSSSRKIDYTRLFHGVDLQLPAYALALENGEAAARVVGFFYWPLSIGLGEAEDEQWAEPGSPEWFKNHRPEGLFDETVVRRLDTAVGAGEAALAFNFRITGKDKIDGRSRSAVPGETLRLLLRRAGRLMQERAEAIARGEIAVRPLREGNRLACDRCDFSSFCRVGTSEGDPFVSLVKVNAKEFAELLKEKQTTETLRH